MANQKWINENGIYYPISGNVVIHTTPGPGIWQVYQSPDPRDPRLGLNFIDNKFNFDFKVYETGGRKIIDRVKKLWNSEEYEETGKNLGVILNGTKGTGELNCPI